MRLTVETGPLAGTVVSLDRAQPALLGSAADCAIQVQEPGVEPHHAVVKALKDKGFGVKALAPGLRLNGERIEASPLRDGDVLELGTTRIAFGQVQDRGLPHIAGYRVLEVLGRGGMGVVYRAEQTSLHREVALKVLNKELTRDPAFVAKFVAEARAAAKLQHPNVVHVFDVDHADDVYFYAMELMHEGSLEDWLRQNGAMPVDRALQVIADAAAGLAYAESLGIVHRDIKPDNLMLDRHGAVKIADLGLARTEEGAEEQTIGTPHFMAPEQVLKKDVDHRTDLYALGCTFYRLITGRTPFRGQTVKDILRAQVRDEPEPPHKVVADVPPEVSAIVLKLLAKDPAERFQTANELIEQLEVLLRPPAKRGLWIGLAVVGVLAAVGAVVWAMTRPKDVEFVEVEKRYDDPEKQQFADEIKVLKKNEREKDALIALLTARCSDLGDRARADAFDEVANAHAGTRAAAEAGERAQALRAAIAERERDTERRQQLVEAELASLRQAMDPLLQAKDFGQALERLAAAPPAPLRDAPEFHQGVANLRDRVLTTARDDLAALESAIAGAVAAKDDEALAKAADAAAAAIATPARWPLELRPALDKLGEVVRTARTSATAIAEERSAAEWRRHREMFASPSGIGANLQSHDFATAAAAAGRFAEASVEPAAAEQARAFAAIAQRAAAFATALEQAASGGQLSLQLDDGTVGTVARWDRSAGVVVVADTSKKPARETPIPTARLSLAAWTALAAQVGAAAPGGRECFLGLVAIAAHADAARAFLGRLRADDDASGTGDAAYPLAPTECEQLQRDLADAGAETWSIQLRDELQAVIHLASGLRALSVRRNMAAAGHIDRLLADHGRSCIVALLP